MHGESWGGETEKPTTTGSGVENLLLHSGAALPIGRSISLSRPWKNLTPGCNPAVVFWEGSCSPTAGCLLGIHRQYLPSTSLAAQVLNELTQAGWVTHTGLWMHALCQHTP